MCKCISIRECMSSSSSVCVYISECMSSVCINECMSSSSVCISECKSSSSNSSSVY